MTSVSDVTVFSLLLQIEADLGYPGGKARIIHKESDIITAFAINKVPWREVLLLRSISVTADA